MKLMVFDVGGTEIKYSVMDEQFHMTDAGSTPTPTESLPVFLDTLHRLYLPHRDQVEGIALSLPGIVDMDRGVVNGGGALTYNWKQPVGPMLSELCGCPVHIANDGKCAALAELEAGSLKGCRNASVFLIGTGVGGGLVIDGKIVQGRHFTAGEYSFVLTDPDHWKSIHDMMGSTCSTTGLLNLYRAMKGLPEDEPINGKQLFERYHKGEAEARDAVQEFSHMVALQIFNLTVLLDLEKVAIGGGISRQPALIDTIQASVQDVFENVPSVLCGASFPPPEVIPCRFSSEANQVGAYLFYRK